MLCNFTAVWFVRIYYLLLLLTPLTSYRPDRTKTLNDEIVLNEVMMSQHCRLIRPYYLLLVTLLPLTGQIGRIHLTTKSYYTK